MPHIPVTTRRRRRGHVPRQLVTMALTVCMEQRVLSDAERLREDAATVATNGDWQSGDRLSETRLGDDERLREDVTAVAVSVMVCGRHCIGSPPTA